MIGILNGRNTTVWVHISIGLLLEAIKLDPGGLVWQVELFKNNENLGRIGNLVCAGVSNVLRSKAMEKPTSPIQLDRLETHCSSDFRMFCVIT